MNRLWKTARYFYTHHAKVLGKLFEGFAYLYGANAISARAEIDTSVRFFHRGLGCVVHPDAVIGRNCNIFPNVILGSQWKNAINRGGGHHILVKTV